MFAAPPPHRSTCGFVARPGCFGSVHCVLVSPRSDTGVLDAASWEPRAACLQVPGLFAVALTAPAPERDERAQAAKAVCSVCPVLAECRDYALRVREPLGVWGGLSEKERRALLSSSTAVS